METLLQLGANVNARSGRLERNLHPAYMMGDDETPPLVHLASDGMREMEGIELLLRYGADINATNPQGETFMHQLFGRFNQRLDALRHLYTHHSSIMFTFDYTLSTYHPRWNRLGVTLIQIAHDAVERSRDSGTDDQAKAKETLDLLEAEQNKQRQLIQQQLLDFTPIIADLADIITEYITPKDWKERLKL